MTPADKEPASDPAPPSEPRETAPEGPREPSPVESREVSAVGARGAWRRPRGRRAALVGLVLVIAAAVGTGLGFAIALPGWLPGPPAARGPAQPSYVIDTQASPSATRRSALPEPSPVPAEYTVEAGDTLRSIADKLYGDANLWPTIYDANRDIIGPDPDALRVGMHLRLPAR